MGNAFSCVEAAGWDSHPDVTNQYVSTEEGVYMDMTAPLSHYFISSGHNSYLTGDQLTSNSGTVTIEMCLKRGCRVIELDVYNEEKKGVGPVCKHGGTMTKSIPFKTCVLAIKEHGFATTPFPVIITIENHTTAENQKVLVAVIKEVLGDMLFIPTPEQVGAPWLSPEALKNKVLIRTNLSHGATPELTEITYIVNTKFSTWGGKIAEEKASSSSLAETKLAKFMGMVTGGTIAECLPAAAAVPAATTVGMEIPLEEEDDDAILSTGTIEEVYTYSARHLLRVYPAGWRVASSNYNPIIAWSSGASFAALNWQNWDKALWVNEGRFKDNGNCGYIKKPDYMLRPGNAHSPTPRQLEVHVYSAFFPTGMAIMCYKDDVYVKLSLEGVCGDISKHSSKVAQNSGKLKVEKTFGFKVKHPEMATLLVQLMDEDVGGVGDDSLGYFSLPLATMSEGDFLLPMYRDRELVKGAWVKLKLSWVTANPLAIA